MPALSPSTSEKDNHVVSTNKFVVAMCTQVKEGTSKLANKICHLHQTNLKKGKEGVIIFLETLAKQLNRSIDSIRLYLNEAVQRGLIFVEKIKSSKHKIRYKLTPTQKLLDIKTDRTVAPPSLISEEQNLNSSTKNLNSSSQPTLTTLGTEGVSEPLYLNISNKGLNSACAHETFQPSVGEKALEVMKKVVDVHRSEPLSVKKELFTRTITKLMKSHFGTIANWRTYCAKVASNPFLMGKKPMKSGDTFTLSIGSLLSEKMIEDSWENKGFFNVYPPKKSKQSPQKDELPKLILEEAIQTIENEKNKEVNQKLYQRLGAATYRSWVYSKEFEAIGLGQQGKPVFTTVSPFSEDWLISHYGDVLKQVFQEVYGVEVEREAV